MNRFLASDGLRGPLMRTLVWGSAGVLLLMPLAVMPFSDEVNWTPMDFAVMGLLLLVVCTAYEIAARIARNNAYLLGAGIGVGTGFLTVWANLAVGIVGNENNPANDIFFGVVAFAILAALAARLRARDLVWAMVATAAVQGAVGLYVGWAGHGPVWVFTGVTMALWLASAALFRASAQS